MIKVVGIGVKGRIAHKRSVCLSILLIAALSASGCAVSGNSLPEITSGDQLVTNSVVEKAKPQGIAETDAEVIKNTVATAKISSKIAPLAWDNPQTGSSGTIVAIDKFMGKHGQRCRGFKTSVDSFMGISFYNGEACQITANKWVLSWFKSAG
ncbi:MAG: RT0821/Lpp0805 family surface protein [Rhizobiaceae bacterium]